MIKLQDIKQMFMAYRNGIVADALRKGGMDYEIIFGLQIPQIAEIASRVKEESAREAETSGESGYGFSTYDKLYDIALSLWNDRKVRESRLLACYLFPVERIDLPLALSLANGVKTREETDILCFRLLRHLPFAWELVERIESSAETSDNKLMDYCSEALRRNLA